MLNILLIESSTTCAALMNVYLKKAIESGYKLTVCKSLKNALFLLEDSSEVRGLNNSHKKTTKFDIVIVDENLRDSKGLNTVEEISYYAKNIPVIATSAEVQNNSKENYLKAGADAFLHKIDIRPKALLDTISKLVDNYARTNTATYMFSHNFS